MEVVADRLLLADARLDAEGREAGAVAEVEEHPGVAGPQVDLEDLGRDAVAADALALALARERVAVEIDQDHIVRGGLFQTDARAFDPVLPGCLRERGNMAVDHIVVPLHGQNTASRGKFFLERHGASSRTERLVYRMILRDERKVADGGSLCQ